MMEVKQFKKNTFMRCCMAEAGNPHEDPYARMSHFPGESGADLGGPQRTSIKRRKSTQLSYVVVDEKYLDLL